LINSICDTALLMAYGEGSRTVGINFVRDAATNLALVDAPCLPHPVVAAAPGRSDSGLKLVPMEVAAPTVPLPGLQPEAGNVTKLPFSSPRTNPSLLRRLAGKLGLPH